MEEDPFIEEDTEVRSHWTNNQGLRLVVPQMAGMMVVAGCGIGVVSFFSLIAEKDPESPSNWDIVLDILRGFGVLGLVLICLGAGLYFTVEGWDFYLNARRVVRHYQLNPDDPVEAWMIMRGEKARIQEVRPRPRKNPRDP